MRKNKRTIEELGFDEASSGSSGESEGEESNYSGAVGKGENSEKRGIDDSSESSSSSSDDDDDDDSETSDNSSSSSDDDDEDKQSQQQVDNKNVDDVHMADEDNNSDDDEDLPLHERIQKREQKGLKMQKIRERKSLALKVAGERLANFKKRKQDNNDGSDNDKTTKEQPQHTHKKKKKSKHAPTEVSSKRSDYYRRGGPLAKLNESGVGVEIGAHRYRPLDPRTSNLHGHFNEEQFEKNYAFLDDIRNKEVSDLKKRIAARKTTGKKGNAMRKRLGITGGGSLEDDQEKLKSLKQQKAEFERRKIGREAKHAVKKKISNEVAEGKRGVYFLKRKEKRRLEMEARLEEIRKRRGDKAVDKAVEKRRKKNKSRDANRFV